MLSRCFFACMLAGFLTLHLYACNDISTSSECISSIDCPVNQTCINGQCHPSSNNPDGDIELEESACPFGSDGCPCAEGRTCDQGLECTAGNLCSLQLADGDNDEPSEQAEEDSPGELEEQLEQDLAEQEEVTPDGDTDLDEEPDLPEQEEAEPELEEESGHLTVNDCWGWKGGSEGLGPDYDQFEYTMGSHCLGTNHQDITGIERVVFVGDSITEGSPPTLIWQYYRYVLTAMLKAKFGEIEVADCAKWGARTDDLFTDNSQIQDCFPEAKRGYRSLMIMTIGGNDLHNWASTWAEGPDAGQTPEETLAIIDGKVDKAIYDLWAGLNWLYEDPNRFPNGIFVITSNTYEYTDATGDLNSCVFAGFAGLGGAWPEGVGPTIRFNEAFMDLSSQFGIDMIFMLENFCGHGFHNTDPASQCFIPPDGGERWFDLTCIHPNPVGHAEIARMFMAVVDE